MSTLRERNVENILKPSLGSHLKMVSFSYKDQLVIINNHLKRLYGELADWSRNLGFYLASPERHHLSYIINGVDDLLKISLGEIHLALQLEEQNAHIAKLACELYKEFATAAMSGKTVDITKLIFAAQMLGVFPVLPEDKKNIPGVLNEYYVVFQIISDEEKRTIREEILSSSEKLGFLSMAVSFMVDVYEEGNLVTFPFVGTMITQSRGKIFWRGENAYYGKSMASIYRTKDYKELSPALFKVVKKLRYDECGFMLDKFDACIHWSKKIADVSYMAIMQHYGLPTDMVDVTSDLKTALFFACCKWKNEGSFNRWVPLGKEDFEKADSRKQVAVAGGDSRYGVIYKERAEIEDLMWLVMNSPEKEGALTKGDKAYLKAWKHIIPVGFQPFARCKAQNAYTLLNDGDLMRDTQFDKVKFRLNEEICHWIYNEMNQGRSIYPELFWNEPRLGNKIPDISKYVSKIAKTKVFSRSVFEGYCELAKLDKKKSERLENDLFEAGFIVSHGAIEFVPKEDLDKINKEYGLDEALKIAEVEIKIKPLAIIG